MIDKSKVKPLIFLAEEGGWKSHGMLNLLDDFDKTRGFKKAFYIKNENRVLSARLLNFKFSDPTYKFTAPDLILPLQTVKASIEIPADSKATEYFLKEILSGKTLDDLRKQSDVEFRGEVLWSVIPKKKELELRLDG